MLNLLRKLTQKKCILKKKNETKLEKNNIEKKEIETIFPNITIPVKIPRSIKDLILPGFLFILGFALPILFYFLNNLFNYGDLIEVIISLIGSGIVALALFVLASLKISS